MTERRSALQTASTGSFWKLFCLIILGGVLDTQTYTAATQTPETSGTWTVRPLSPALLQSTKYNQWQNVIDTEVNFTLTEPAPVYLLYQLNAMAHNSRPTNDFGLATFADLLLGRLVVNGHPFRQSGTSVSPNLFQKEPILHLHGGVVLNLPRGSHHVRLQWKKHGDSVDVYTSTPAGTGSSSLVPEQITSQHSWEDIESIEQYDGIGPLSGEYIVTLRSFPNRLVKDFGQTSMVSARVCVNSRPIENSETHLKTSSVSSMSVTLASSFEVPTFERNATITLQWRIKGEKKTWRADPTVLDGFAGGRILSIFSPRSRSQRIRFPSDDLPIDSLTWQDVPTGLIINSVDGSGAFHVSYTIDPRLSRTTGIFKAMLVFRLTLDESVLPRTAVQSAVDSQHLQTITSKSVHQSVDTGTHTIRLQVKALNSSMFYGFDNIVSDVMNLFKVTVLFSDNIGLNNKPEIRVERIRQPLVTLEDEDLEINGIYFSDIDQNLIEEMKIKAVICLGFGHFKELSPLDDGCFNKSGSMVEINKLVNRLTYVPYTNFFGNDLLSIQVNDLGNVGSGGPKEALLRLHIEVVPVNDPVRLSPTQSFVEVMEGFGTSLPQFQILDDDREVITNSSVLVNDSNYSMTLEATFGHFSGLSSESTPTSIMNISASIEELHKVLSDIYYQVPSGNKPDKDPRIVLKVCDDGTFGVEEASVNLKPRKQRVNECAESKISVSIVPVNNAPVVEPFPLQVLSLDVEGFSTESKVVGAAQEFLQSEKEELQVPRKSTDGTFRKSSVVVSQRSAASGWTALRLANHSGSTRPVDFFLSVGNGTTSIGIEEVELTVPQNSQNFIEVPFSHSVPGRTLKCVFLTLENFTTIVVDIECEPLCLQSSGPKYCQISPSELWRRTRSSKFYVAVYDETNSWSNFISLNLRPIPKNASRLDQNILESNLDTFFPDASLSSVPFFSHLRSEALALSKAITMELDGEFLCENSITSTLHVILSHGSVTVEPTASEKSLNCSLLRIRFALPEPIVLSASSLDGYVTSTADRFPSSGKIFPVTLIPVPSIHRAQFINGRNISVVGTGFVTPFNKISCSCTISEGTKGSLEALCVWLSPNQITCTLATAVNESEFHTVAVSNDGFSFSTPVKVSSQDLPVVEKLALHPEGIHVTGSGFHTSLGIGCESIAFYFALVINDTFILCPQTTLFEPVRIVHKGRVLADLSSNQTESTTAAGYCSLETGTIFSNCSTETLQYFDGSQRSSSGLSEDALLDISRLLSIKVTSRSTSPAVANSTTVIANKLEDCKLQLESIFPLQFQENDSIRLFSRFESSSCEQPTLSVGKRICRTLFLSQVDAICFAGNMPPGIYPVSTQHSNEDFIESPFSIQVFGSISSGTISHNAINDETFLVRGHQWEGLSEQQNLTCVATSQVSVVEETVNVRTIGSEEFECTFHFPSTKVWGRWEIFIVLDGHELLEKQTVTVRPVPTVLSIGKAIFVKASKHLLRVTGENLLEETRIACIDVGIEAKGTLLADSLVVFRLPPISTGIHVCFLTNDGISYSEALNLTVVEPPAVAVDPLQGIAGQSIPLYIGSTIAPRACRFSDAQISEVNTIQRGSNEINICVLNSKTPGNVSVEVAFGDLGFQNSGWTVEIFARPRITSATTLPTRRRDSGVAFAVLFEGSGFDTRARYLCAVDEAPLLGSYTEFDELNQPYCAINRSGADVATAISLRLEGTILYRHALLDTVQPAINAVVPDRILYTISDSFSVLGTHLDIGKVRYCNLTSVGDPLLLDAELIDSGRVSCLDISSLAVGAYQVSLVYEFQSFVTNSAILKSVLVPTISSAYIFTSTRSELSDLLMLTTGANLESGFSCVHRGEQVEATIFNKTSLICKGLPYFDGNFSNTFGLCVGRACTNVLEKINVEHKEMNSTSSPARVKEEYKSPIIEHGFVLSNPEGKMVLQLSFSVPGPTPQCEFSDAVVVNALTDFNGNEYCMLPQGILASQFTGVIFEDKPDKRVFPSNCYFVGPNCVLPVVNRSVPSSGCGHYEMYEQFAKSTRLAIPTISFIEPMVIVNEMENNVFIKISGQGQDILHCEYECMPSSGRIEVTAAKATGNGGYLCSMQCASGSKELRLNVSVYGIKSSREVVLSTVDFGESQLSSTCVVRNSRSRIQVSHMADTIFRNPLCYFNEIAVTGDSITPNVIQCEAPSFARDLEEFNLSLSLPHTNCFSLSRRTIPILPQVNSQDLVGRVNGESLEIFIRRNHAHFEEPCMPIQCHIKFVSIGAPLLRSASRVNSTHLVCSIHVPETWESEVFVSTSMRNSSPTGFRLMSFHNQKVLSVVEVQPPMFLATYNRGISIKLQESITPAETKGLRCLFENVNANVSTAAHSATALAISCTPGPLPFGIYTLALVDTSGTIRSNALSVTILRAPRLTGSSTRLYQNVRVRGNGFVEGTLSCRLCEDLVSGGFRSRTEISCTIPSGINSFEGCPLSVEYLDPIGAVIGSSIVPHQRQQCENRKVVETSEYVKIDYPALTHDLDKLECWINETRVKWKEEDEFITCSIIEIPQGENLLHLTLTEDSIETACYLIDVVPAPVLVSLTPSLIEYGSTKRLRLGGHNFFEDVSYEAFILGDSKTFSCLVINPLLIDCNFSPTRTGLHTLSLARQSSSMNMSSLELTVVEPVRLWTVKSVCNHRCESTVSFIGKGFCDNVPSVCLADNQSHVQPMLSVDCTMLSCPFPRSSVTTVTVHFESGSSITSPVTSDTCCRDEAISTPCLRNYEDLRLDIDPSFHVNEVHMELQTMERVLISVEGYGFGNIESPYCLATGSEVGEESSFPCRVLHDSVIQCDGLNLAPAEYSVSVLDLNSGAKSREVFSLLGPVPTLANFEPRIVEAKGGDILILRGSNFVRSTPFYCHIGTLAVPAVVQNSTAMFCRVPEIQSNSSVHVAIATSLVLLKAESTLYAVTNDFNVQNMLVPTWKEQSLSFECASCSFFEIGDLSCSFLGTKSPLTHVKGHCYECTVLFPGNLSSSREFDLSLAHNIYGRTPFTGAVTVAESPEVWDFSPRKIGQKHETVITLHGIFPMRLPLQCALAGRTCQTMAISPSTLRCNCSSQEARSNLLTLTLSSHSRTLLKVGTVEKSFPAVIQSVSSFIEDSFASFDIQGENLNTSSIFCRLNLEFHRLALCSTKATCGCSFYFENNGSKLLLDIFEESLFLWRYRQHANYDTISNGSKNLANGTVNHTQSMIVDSLTPFHGAINGVSFQYRFGHSCRIFCCLLDECVRATTLAPGKGSCRFTQRFATDAPIQVVCGTEPVHKSILSKPISEYGESLFVGSLAPVPLTKSYWADFGSLSEDLPCYAADSIIGYVSIASGEMYCHLDQEHVVFNLMRETFKTTLTAKTRFGTVFALRNVVFRRPPLLTELGVVHVVAGENSSVRLDGLFPLTTTLKCIVDGRTSTPIFGTGGVVCVVLLTPGEHMLSVALIEEDEYVVSEAKKVISIPRIRIHDVEQRVSPSGLLELQVDTNDLSLLKRPVCLVNEQASSAHVIHHRKISCPVLTSAEVLNLSIGTWAGERASLSTAISVSRQHTPRVLSIVPSALRSGMLGKIEITFDMTIRSGLLTLFHGYKELFSTTSTSVVGTTIKFHVMVKECSPLLRLAISLRLHKSVVRFNSHIPCINAVSLTSVSPSIARTTSPVILRGNRFRRASSYVCIFKGDKSKETTSEGIYLSPKRLHCTLGEMKPGKYHVDVADEFGSISNDVLALSVVGPPRLVACDPCIGSRFGGTRIIITGQNFLPADQRFCRFGAVTSKALVLSSEKIVCFSPGVKNESLLSAGTLTISSQALVEGSLPFSFFHIPIVTSVSPSVLTFGDRALITLDLKEQISTATIRAICRFTMDGSNEVLAETHGTAKRTIQCDSPLARQWRHSDDELLFVSVTFSLDQGNQFYSTGKQLTLVPPPEIHRFSPSAGPINGGTDVSVFGRHFTQLQGLKCNFGDSSVMPMLISTTQLVCESPKQRLSGEVLLTISQGNVNSSGHNMFSYYFPEHIESVHPHRVNRDGGDMLVYRGSNFGSFPELSCSFGTSRISATFVNESTVTCRTPMHPVGHVLVSLANNGQDFVDSDNVIGVEKAAVIQSVTPSLTVITGGSVVFLIGTDFRNSSSLSCLVGDVVVACNFCNSSAIQLLSPASPSGLPESFAVEVSFNGRDYTNNLRQLNYHLEPRILQIVPAILWATTRSSVQITGRNFLSTRFFSCRVLDPMRSFSQVSDAQFLSPSKAVCSVPTLPIGNYLVQISLNGREFYPVIPNGVFTKDTNGTLAQVALDVVTPIDVQTIAPLDGVVFPGSLVLLRAAGLPQTGSINVICLMSSAMSHGTVLGDMIECKVPLILFNESLYLSISMNGQELSNPVALHVANPPVIQRVAPAILIADRATTVTVTGEIQSVVDLECRFFEGLSKLSMSSAAFFLDNSTLQCVGPTLASFIEETGIVVRNFGYGSAFRSSLTLPTAHLRLVSRGDVLSTNSVPIQFVSSPALWAMKPEIWLETNSIVTIEGFFPLNSEGLFCKVRTRNAEKTLLMSSVLVLEEARGSCIFDHEKLTPARYVLELTVEGTKGNFGEVEFEVVVSPEPENVVPAYVSAEEYTLLSIYGANFMALNSLRQASNGGLTSSATWHCRVNEVSFLASVVSDQELRCHIPPQNAQTTRLRLVFNGILLSWEKDMFVKKSVLITEAQPKVFSTKEIRTVVTLSPTDKSPAFCSVGSIQSFVLSCDATIDSIVCVCNLVLGITKQSMTGMTVPLSLTFEDGTRTKNAVGIRIVPQPIVTFIDVSELGENNTGLLRIRGFGFVNSDAIRCVVSAGNDSLVPLVPIFNTSRELYCPFDAEHIDFLHSMEETVHFRAGVTNDNSSIVWYTFPVVSVSSFSLSGISPALVDPQGGTIVSISGSRFSGTGASCVIGLHEIPATLVTPTLIQCQILPKRDLKQSSNSIAVKMDGVFSKNALTYSYHRMLTLSSISPNSGAISGNTTVSILLSESHNFSKAFCKFGDSIVEGTCGGNKISCITPAMGQQGAVNVLVSFDGQMFSATALRFNFYLTPIITSVSPMETWSGIPIRLRVSGLRFVCSPSVSCQFGGVTTRGRCVTGHVLCTFPAMPPTEGPVALSFNGQDSEASSRSNLRVLKHPTVHSISPTILVATIRTDVRVVGSNFGTGTWQCIFQEKRVKALRINDNELICSVLPTLFAANDSLSIELEGVGIVEAAIGLEVTPAFTTSESVITKYGLFQSDSRNDVLQLPVERDTVQSGNCFVGDLKLSTTVSFGKESSSKITCAINGDATARKGDNFLLGLAFPAVVSAEAKVKSLPRPTVAMVQPLIASTDGTTSLRLTGSQFPVHHVQCKIGDQLVKATHISPGVLTCNAPSHIPGTVPLALIFGDGSAFFSGFHVEYKVPPQIFQMRPSAGPLSGGTLVTVVGSGLSRMHNMTCNFGHVNTPAVAVETGNRMLCLSPSFVAPRAVPFSVSVGSIVSPASEKAFLYTFSPIIRRVTPSTVTIGGTSVVLVYGYFPALQDASEEGACRFGQFTAPMRVLSLTLVECETQFPDAIQGFVAPLELTLNGVDFFTSGLNIAVKPLIDLFSISPSSGGVSGGTVVTLRGEGFSNSIFLKCRFGHVVVSAWYINSTSAFCASPPRIPGPSSISLSNNGIDFSRSIDFSYFEDPSVFDMFPRQTLFTGQTPVLVRGAHFRNTSELQCSFSELVGSSSVGAIFLSSSLIVCFAPSKILQGSVESSDLTVPLEVTNNGVDYSNSRNIFTFVSRCPVGSYCNHLEIMPAPNGTISPGEGNANYTLCPPSTFQPRSGQAKCLVCPIGYFCPDFGLSQPVICKSGYVCDEKGLVTPFRPCIPGHYCNTGVKTNDQFDFDLDSVQFGKDPVKWIRQHNGTLVFDKDSRKESKMISTYPEAHTSVIQWTSVVDILAEMPFPCLAGYYCRSGVAVALPTSKNFSTPQKCFDGFFCPAGSTSPQGSGPCPTGHYCPPGFRAFVCPKRHYCPSVGNLKPRECDPGTYNPFEGRSRCNICPKGHICPREAMREPVICPAGLVCNERGLILPVVMCPAGYICDPGTAMLPLDAEDSQSGRRFLATGEQEELRNEIILELLEIPNSSTLHVIESINLVGKKCQAGTFCLGGVASNQTLPALPIYGVEGLRSPQPCPDGKFCGEGTTSSSGSDSCPPGSYCPRGAATPLSSLRGTFSSGSGSVAPSLCFPGTYAPVGGHKNCRVCPSGYSCDGFGTYRPSICPKGTYRSQADRASCRVCPPGTFSDRLGAVSVTDCLPCPMGRICGEAAIKDLSVGSTACPEGFACGLFTTLDSMFDHTCPAGYFCFEETSPDSQLDHRCGKGNYCLRRTRAFLSTRNKCFVNHFCPTGTADSKSIETFCPPGTSSSAGSSSLLQCEIAPFDVCDKSPKRRYYDTFEYHSEGTRRVIDDEETVVRVQRMIDPMNISRSDPSWKNDTVYIKALCPVGVDLSVLSEGTVRDTNISVGGVGFEGLFPFPPVCRFEDSDSSWVQSTMGEIISDVTMLCPLPSRSILTALQRVNVRIHGIGSSQFSNSLELALDQARVATDEDCLDSISALGVESLKFPQSFSELPTNLRWFAMTGLSVARINFDFSHISSEVVYGEHFSIAIFVTPSVCVNTKCDETRKLIPNREENRALLEESPCVKPLELSHWFESDEIEKHNTLELTMFALEDLLVHIEIHLLHGMYIPVAEELFNTSSISITSPSRAISNLGAGDRILRQLSDHLTSQEKLVPKEFIFAVVFTRNSLRSISAPLNMPPRFAELERGRVLTGFNASAESPWVLNEPEELQIGPEYWEPPRGDLLASIDKYREIWHEVDTEKSGNPQYRFERLLLPFFPYVSSCRGYDSFISIAAFTEDSHACKVPSSDYVSESRENFDALPHPDDIKVVGPIQVFQSPVGDTCHRSIECKYEEDITTVDTHPRWFEVDTGETMFEIIRRPITLDEFFANGKTIDKVEDEIGIDGFIPVSVDKSAARTELRSHCGRQCFPREITLVLEYYQISLFEKRLIRADAVFETFDRDTDNKDYSFGVVMYPLNWLQLVINFAFDRPTFLSIFVVVGAMTLGAIMIYWAIHRLLTRQAAPPKFRFLSFWSIVVPAPTVGYMFSMLPIAVVIAFFYGIINGSSQVTGVNEEDVGFTGFENIVGHWMDTSVDIREVDSIRSGRIGFCFLILAMYLLVVGSRLLVPRIVSKTEKRNLQRPSTDGRVSIWHPTTWKRSNIVLVSILIALFLLFVVEFSFWRNYGDYIWYFLVILKVVARVINSMLEAQLREYLLILPLMASINVITALVTLGATDFADFLLAYAIEYALMVAERVYVGPAADAMTEWTVRSFQNLKNMAINFVKRHSRLTLKQEVELEQQQAKELQQLLLKPKPIEGEETVEPILSAFGDYTADLVALFFHPFTVILLIVFRNEVQIPDLYDIRAQDIEFYLWFFLVVFTFQLAADMFLHNVLELVYGWKIHDYLVYVRYRFLQRETRWKGMEEKLDECIDESMRSLDQMCFSSQFYLMVFVHTSGIIFIVFAVEIMVRAEYNMFGDPANFILAPLLLIFIYILKTILVLFANIFGLWKIRDKDSSPWTTDMDQSEGWNVPDLDEMLEKSSAGKPKYNTWIMNQRLATETFRFKFLDYNRAWLISVLPKILTPRTLARSRPYLLAQFAQMLADYDEAEESSDGEGGIPTKRFKQVALPESGKDILRMWLEDARKSLQMRDSVLATINAAKTSLQSKHKEKVDVEMMMTIDDLGNKWRQQYPQEYKNFDLRAWKAFFNKNQKYRVVRPGSSGPRVIGSPLFLQPEHRRPKASAPPTDASGSVPRDQISAATKAIAQFWYTRAQGSLNSRQGGPRAISASTAAIARKWLQLVRRGR